MRILVTGAKGFVGKNLVAELSCIGGHEIYEVDIDTPLSTLEKYVSDCDFVFHLAGVNRPEKTEDFMKGNFGFTSDLLNLLTKYNNKAPILITSSIQAELNNPYGISKKAGEDLIFNYGKSNNSTVYVYRLVNLFGKWSKPNYNSVVATFCYNITHNIDITISSPETEVELCHIDDVLKEFVGALSGKVHQKEQFCYISTTKKITLKNLSEKLYSFKKTRDTNLIPLLNNDFDRALYGTYVSYLSKDNFGYSLTKKTDQRGWLVEFIKSPAMGQVFVSKTLPGITRGNHWHHTKAEKFLVVQGTGIIKFRDINSKEIISYEVDGENPFVLDIPTGYTHNIKNTGEEQMITLFWSTEIFNPDNPDTYYLEVE